MIIDEATQLERELQAALLEYMLKNNIKARYEVTVIDDLEKGERSLHFNVGGFMMSFGHPMRGSHTQVSDLLRYALNSFESIWNARRKKQRERYQWALQNASKPFLKTNIYTMKEGEPMIHFPDDGDRTLFKIAFPTG